MATVRLMLVSDAVFRCIYEIKELDYNKWKQRSDTELLLRAYFSLCL